MTELEWCRENAPNALKSMSDDMLLQYMHETYVKFCLDKESVEPDLTELNESNNYMDIMVRVLTRQFGDKITFKGGYMLTKLIPQHARQTQDIDFSIASSDLYKSLMSAMNEIGEQFVKRGYISKYIVKNEIREFMSGGMDMYDSIGAKILGIDVGWHDLSFGTTTTTIDIGDVRAFTIERMLSDKITAILSRKRFRRPKDIYDLYCITNCFDFDPSLVRDYIIKRTNGADADWDNIPFTEDVLREYLKAYNSLKLFSIRKNEALNRPEFEVVINRFYIVCQGVHTDMTTKIWRHDKGYFE